MLYMCGNQEGEQCKDCADNYDVADVDIPDSLAHGLCFKEQALETFNLIPEDDLNSMYECQNDVGYTLWDRVHQYLEEINERYSGKEISKGEVSADK